MSGTLIVSLLLVCRKASASGGVASTPPMGFNTWNKFKCGTSGEILMGVADQFHTLGLAAAGYEFVNSDDCWMDLERADGPNGTVGAGPQVPNPTKFPQGMRAVADYIHSKNLKIGLYTARAPRTCAGFAGSCHFEHVDAAQWTNWTIDYMKDDSCGGCGTAENDYTVMQVSSNFNISGLGDGVVVGEECPSSISFPYFDILAHDLPMNHSLVMYYYVLERPHSATLVATTLCLQSRAYVRVRHTAHYPTGIL